jgi:hypothetical protein
MKKWNFWHQQSLPNMKKSPDAFMVNCGSSLCGLSVLGFFYFIFYSINFHLGVVIFCYVSDSDGC